MPSFMGGAYLNIGVGGVQRRGRRAWTRRGRPVAEGVRRLDRSPAVTVRPVGRGVRHFYACVSGRSDVARVETPHHDIPGETRRRENSESTRDPRAGSRRGPRGHDRGPRRGGEEEEEEGER